MVDDLRSDDGLSGFDGHLQRSTRRIEKERPLADREVPLGQQETDTRSLSPAIHAWLDGELPEASVRKGEMARDVEFWKGLSGAIEQRRRMATPANLEARIMDALPRTAPNVITPWFRREFVITPAAAVGAVAAIVALSAAVTASVFAFMR